MIYFLFDNNILIDLIITKVYYIIITQHKYIINLIRCWTDIQYSYYIFRLHNF